MAKTAADQKCYFESEEFAKKRASELENAGPVGRDILAGIQDKDFKDRMDQLIETGARSPTMVSMSDWYYMRDHAEKCPRCKSKFAKLAAKNPEVDGPKILE